MAAKASNVVPAGNSHFSAGNTPSMLGQGRGMAKPRQLESGHWRIRCKDSTGKRRSATYSTYQEAVNEQRLKAAEAALTGAGRLSVPTKRYRVKDLAAYWVKHRAQLKRSGSDDIWMINRHLLPVSCSPCISVHPLRGGWNIIRTSLGLDKRTPLLNVSLS